MDPELKAIIDKLQSAWADFRTSNDARLAQVEARGTASADTLATVERSNQAITDLTARLHEIENSQREIRAAQAVLEVTDRSASERTDEERRMAAAFHSRISGRTLAATRDALTDDDVSSYRAYRSAFAQYIVRGDSIPAEVRNALQTGSDPDGGFWVPPTVTARVTEFLRETSPMRQVATTETIGTDVLEGDVDLDEAGSGWVGETEARTETGTPKLPSKWTIPLAEQYAEPRTTQRMLDFSTRDPEVWLARKVAEKLSREENKQFINGDGIKKPLGLLSKPNANAPTPTNWQRMQFVLSGAAGAFAATSPGDVLIDIVATLKAGYRRNAAWYTSRLTLAAARKLKDGQGNYLWVPNFQAGNAGQLLGFPVRDDFEDFPALAADSLSLAFGDMAQTYTIVDHTTGLRVLRDPLTLKGWVKFYSTKFTGGGVVNYEAMKLLKFAA